MDHADTHATPLSYKRHEPEKTLLYEVLAREWDRWFAERQADSERAGARAVVPVRPSERRATGTIRARINFTDRLG